MYSGSVMRRGGPVARALAVSLTQPKSQVRFFNRRALTPFINDFPPVEDFMRDIDRQFQRMERQINSMLSDFNLARPLLSSRSFRPAVESELVSEGNPSIYSLNIYLGEGVDPEKIKLTLKDKVLTVEAKVEHESEDGTTKLYQEITKKITLPDNIDPKDVKSHLNPDGSLLIEATLPVVEAQKPKEIPINTDQQVS